MGTAFWIRRFLLVFASALAIIAGAQMLKGHTLGYALFQGMLWAAIASTIFTAARIYQSRRGQHCAICRDTPETSARAGETGSNQAMPIRRIDKPQDFPQAPDPQPVRPGHIEGER